MISVIIPTYNEGDIIYQTVITLKSYDKQNNIDRILVCDGGSSDNTIDEAKRGGAEVMICNKGRALQLNGGARVATGEILYFLHADTLPPPDYLEKILKAYSKGYSIGCFRLVFDIDHWFLKANAWFTRFNINLFRFGDQSLFVAKEVFIKSGGFDEKLIMLEDQEIIPRLKLLGKFIVLNKPVTTSSRKYLKNGIYKTQSIYFFIYILYKLGFKQSTLLKLYKKMIVQDKL